MFEVDEYSRNYEISPKSVITFLIYALSFIAVAWHFYYAQFRPIGRTHHGIVHFGFLGVIFYLNLISYKDGSIDVGNKTIAISNIISVIFAILISAISIYAYLNYFRWLEEGRNLFLYTDLDLVISILIVLIAIHSTKRAYGYTISLVVIGILLYGRFGTYFPGILNHSGFSAERLLHMNVITLRGFYGFLMEVGATWVVIFIIFAGFIESYGGLAYIQRLSKRLASNVEAGIMEVAVVSSMIVGSIMGSSAANTATTGSFTIPMMKDHDVDPEFAGAIESVASTGGQLLPPIMGSTAFVMADILGISYFDVIVAALLPAFLMYIIAALAVWLVSHKNGWTGNAEIMVEDSPYEIRWKNYVEPLPYVLPFILLILLLAVRKMDPLPAGLFSGLSVIGFALIRDMILEGVSIATIWEWSKDTLEGCKIGMVNMAPLTIVLGSLGIVIRTLVSTGFTGRFSIRVVALAGGVLAVLLFLVMFTSILMGMGMPTIPAYVVVAILAAPPLVELGIDPTVAHLFVLYFAVLSTITPPVALTCAVASGISGASFWGTAKKTLKLGTYLFLIPFSFVLHSELVIWGPSTVPKFFSILIALLGLTIAFIGYDYNHISYLKRSVYLVFSLIIIFNPLVLLPNTVVTYSSTLVILFVFISSHQKILHLRPTI
jgi:TRAP transporter 4TM/12TM fusion protein